MKNIILLLIIATLGSCMSSRDMSEFKIRNLSYDVYQEDKKVALAYDEEVSLIIDNWAYVTKDLQIIPWESAYKHIVAGETLPKKVSSDNPFVPVKFWDSKSKGYVDTIKVESIKALVSKGEELWFKTIFATEENLDLKIPTVEINGKEYIMSFFEDVNSVCQSHGIMDFYYADDIPSEWMNKVIFITPYVKGRTEIMVKNGCGNISIVNPDEIYIYIPRSFVVKEDRWLNPSSEMAKIKKSRKKESLEVVQSSREISQDQKRQRVKVSKKTVSQKSDCPNPYNRHKSKDGKIYTKICLKGDGLYKVSKRFGVPLNELLKLNPKVNKRSGKHILFGEYIRLK